MGSIKKNVTCPSSFPSPIFTWIVIFFLVVSFSSSQSYAQQDSTLIKKDSLRNLHSPTKATIMSAVLPGLGQFYNKKYWKLPIVYVGLGVITYFAITNYQQYKSYQQAYSFRTDSDSTTIDTKYAQYSTASILSAENYYRRNYELSCILDVLVYLLNIIDASVDANLFDFSIKDDISLHVSPISGYSGLNSNHSINGIKLTLKF